LSHVGGRRVGGGRRRGGGGRRGCGSSGYVGRRVGVCGGCCGDDGPRGGGRRHGGGRRRGVGRCRCY